MKNIVIIIGPVLLIAALAIAQSFTMAPSGTKVSLLSACPAGVVGNGALISCEVIAMAGEK